MSSRPLQAFLCIFDAKHPSRLCTHSSGCAGLGRPAHILQCARPCIDISIYPQLTASLYCRALEITSSRSGQRRSNCRLDHARCRSCELTTARIRSVKHSIIEKRTARVLLVPTLNRCSHHMNSRARPHDRSICAKRWARRVEKFSGCDEGEKPRSLARPIPNP